MVVTCIVVSTTGTITCFVLMVEEIKKLESDASLEYIWFAVSSFWLVFVVLVQVLMLVLLFKAYKVIKHASRTLGI